MPALVLGTSPDGILNLRTTVRVTAGHGPGPGPALREAAGPGLGPASLIVQVSEVTTLCSGD